MTIHPDQVARRWIHSREEDHGDEVVFRTEDFDFPPARGRDGFILNDDGSMYHEAPGADDSTTQKPASWHIESGNRLVLEDPDRGSKVYEVMSVDNDRLALKKLA